METKIAPHWFTRGILGIFSFLFTLMGTVGVYLLIYKDTINTLLIGSESDLTMKVIIILLTISIIGISILFLFYKWRVSVALTKAFTSLAIEFRRGSYFSLFLISNIIGFGGIAGAYIVSDTSIKDLPIDESIFVRSDFDYGNPVYTDEKICSDYTTYINTLPDITGNGFYSNDPTLTGSIFTSILDPKNPQFWMTDIKQETEKSKNYLEEHKNTKEFQDTLSEIAKKYIISDVEYTILQKKIIVLPDTMECYVRSDNDIPSEFSPSLTHNLKTFRILGKKANMLAWEGRLDEAIMVINTLHLYNQKIGAANTNILSEMIKGIGYNIEYATIENIWNTSSNEQKNKLREIVKDGIDFDRDFRNAIRGEYYFFNHALTGRGKNLKDINIPFLFDSEDTLNRAIILGYAQMLLEKPDTDKLLETYRTYFHTPMEASLIGSDEGIGNNPFSYMHNFLGKRYVYQMLPAFRGYKKRVEQTMLYQEYLKNLMQ